MVEGQGSAACCITAFRAKGCWPPVVREDPWYRVMPGLTCFVWAAEPRAVAYTLLFSSIHDPLLDNGRLLTTAAAL